MTRALYLILATALLFLGIFSCNEATEPVDKSDEMVVLSGLVIDAETAAPIFNAVVRILNFSPEQIAITDSAGKFTFIFEVKETREFEITAFRENFFTDTVSVLAVPGRIINDLRLNLFAIDIAVRPSGEAASVILSSVSSPAIGVRESGAQEVAEITFQVQDSTGIPVDVDHSVLVRFQIGSSPGGGAFLHPASGQTGKNGLVRTNLFSGDSAGVVQIIAEVEQSGRILRSKPVSVAIHGGLPDLNHFSLASEKLNFPGYNLFGLKNGITAYVGDKYGNPVKPNTPIYFTTTGGLIEGSAQTDALGQARVDLVSAAPRPLHPVLGAGFATITGRTADEHQNTIEAQTIILFSGIPQISVNPATINIPDQGSQFISYTVSDQNGNPLAGGTSISVTVESGDVKVTGNIDVTLPDTQSPSWTNFGFTLVDAKPDTLLPNIVNVKISTSGPNGDLEAVISGTSR